MRVLVVEDEKKLGELLGRGLREEGYAADVADRGEEALWMARAVPYDAIVLDVMLPGADGFEVCRRLRRDGVWTPVLMLTARDEVDDRVGGLDAGADDYLTKPFDLGELLARVRALGRRAGAPATLRLGPLVIDVAARKVSLDGKGVDLTARELALLSYLVQHAGRAVSRTELLQKVWNTSFDPGSNVVEVHVRNLRDKLGEHGKLVETVRGVGYRAAAGP